MAKKGKFIASDLNKVVTFLKNEVIINDSGFREEIEIELLTTRAYVNNLSFKELYKVDKIDILNTKTLVIRYNPELIDMDLNVKYNNQVYSIKHIENIDEANRFLNFTIEKIGL